MRRIEMIGKVFGKLTVVAEASQIKKQRVFVCECGCGKSTHVRGNDLRSGLQVSCGCHKNAQTAQRNKDNATHGMSLTPAYRSWSAMRDRCYQPKSASWRWYGAKGIQVCEAWHNFDNFARDMGERPEGKTLDRIDSRGNYEPSNCRWATPKEQTANRGHA